MMALDAVGISTAFLTPLSIILSGSPAKPSMLTPNTSEEKKILFLQIYTPEFLHDSVM